MDDHILERCYAIQAKHLSLDEAIEYQYKLASEIVGFYGDDVMSFTEQMKHANKIADYLQVAKFLEELRCARNDIEKLKAEVKELRETNRRYLEMLKDYGNKDSEIIRLEDFVKAFYRHLEEYHNEESKGQA